MCHRAISLTSATAILAIVVSVISICIGLQNARNTTFINNITASRIKYRDSLKDTFSKFCGLTKWYILGGYASKDIDTFLKEMDRLYYLAKLDLDANHNFDTAILNQMENILRQAKPAMTFPEPVEQELNNLSVLVKRLLDYEWQLAKIEAKKGNVPKGIKAKMEKRYLDIDC